MQDEIDCTEKNVETDDTVPSGNSCGDERIDSGYKKKVMDDLDALLADLQNTTANISSYQHNQRREQQHSPVSDIPQDQQPQYNANTGNTQYNYQYQQHPNQPQPPTHLYQPDHQQQYPQQQYPQPHSGNVLPSPGSNVYYTIDAVNSDDQAYSAGGSVGSIGSPDGYRHPVGYHSGGEYITEGRKSSGSSTPPPLPPPPPSDVLDSLVHAQRIDIGPPQQNNPNPGSFHDQTGSVQTRTDTKGRGERMSVLSNNLSELDQLLQDLNSAQFMAEVDRKSTVNDIPVMVNGVNPIPTGHQPQGHHKPQRSVDSLLDELETTPKFPVESQYQDIGPPNHAHPQSSSSTSSSPFPGQSSSSATKELDDLMMSLSEFKVQDKDGGHGESGEPTYAKPVKSRTNSAASPTTPTSGYNANGQPTQLDNMLGDLQSDMSKQGVNTKQKGVCAACSKPIIGQVIAALGQTWHIEHFTCAHCEEPLGTRNFYERDGMAYCETDYHHLFAPRCAYCNGPIVDKCITALEKMWHPEHFFCAQCGQPFGEDDFHEKNGKAYCRDDYFAMFAPKCGGCGHPIMENYISALNRQWHPQCFVCWDCRAPFGTGSFFDYEGLPYCETHYHAKKGSLCANCEKPITGRCITAMFKKFHPEHFVCAFCLKQLNKGTFKEQNDKPYCHPCFVKLFG